MTYLLDANVVREIGPRGHANVRAWLRAVPDGDLCISAYTFFEMRRRRDAARAETLLAGFDALRSAYAGRIVPVDDPVLDEWARLLGVSDKHRGDMALAATARVHGLVLVTRNVDDFRGREVRVLDPFKREPEVNTV